MMHFSYFKELGIVFLSYGGTRIFRLARSNFKIFLEKLFHAKKKVVFVHLRASGGGVATPPPRISRMEHLELSQADDIFPEETSSYL